MRHHHIDHGRIRPETFAIIGPAAFIANTLGWDSAMSDANLDHAIRQHTENNHAVVEALVGGERKTAVIVAWEAGGLIGARRYKVKLQTVDKIDPRDFAKDVGYGFQSGRLRHDPVVAADYPTDPWVKVGTTTIDGTLEQVGGAMLNGGKPSTLRSDSIEEFIDERIKSQEPIQVGGRWLRIIGAHINSHASTALIRCDIVRRQSEIEDERTAWDRELAMRAMSPVLSRTSPSCPECGPHGNRGRVMLASIEVACTTCAGGKPGDAFGTVAEVPPPHATSVYYGIDMVGQPDSFDHVGHKPGLGWTVRPGDEAHVRAPDGTSWVVSSHLGEPIKITITE